MEKERKKQQNQITTIDYKYKTQSLGRKDKINEEQKVPDKTNKLDNKVITNIIKERNKLRSLFRWIPTGKITDNLK